MTEHPTILVPRPPFDQASCDFCNSCAPPWAYPAKDFEVSIIDRGDGSVLTVRSQGAWAACEECAQLIESSGEDGLARRASSSPGNPPLSGIRLMHDQFRAHRDGPRFLLG